MTAAVRAIDPEDTKVLDVSALLTLFESVFAVSGSWVTLFEDRTPGAEYAGRLFASAKNLTIEINTVCDGAPFQVVHIRKGHEAIISIHRTEVKP